MPTNSLENVICFPRCQEVLLDFSDFIDFICYFLFSSVTVCHSYTNYASFKGLLMKIERDIQSNDLYMLILYENHSLSICGCLCICI